MSAAFLAEAALKSVLCAGLTLLALRLLARRSAAERSWVAHVGLLATIAAPFAGELLPRWYVAPVSLAGAMPPSPIADTSPSVPATAALATTPAIQAPAAETMPAIDLDTLLAFGWALPALLLLLTTAVAVARLVTLRQRATVLTDQPWLSALAHAQRRMGFKNGAALLVSRDFASPVSWGIIRPTIVVNETALAADRDAEAIIAHELAHVARLDWVKLLVARAATALFWFNPLVWALARACHQLREEAADDAVLLSDVRDTDYAALLVGAARHEQNGLLLAANGVAPSRSSLGRRVARVLDGTVWRAPATVGWSVACMGIGVLLAGPLGMMTAAPPPLPTLRYATQIAAKAAQPTIAAPATTSQPTETAVRSEPTPVAARARIATAAPLQLTSVAPPAAPAPIAAAPAAPAPAPPAPPTPPAYDTIGLLANGITKADIAEWAAISPAYGKFSTGELVALRGNRIDAAWLREMAALGYRDLPFRSVLMLAAQDVKPRYIREMAAVGYDRLTVEQLIAMRIHGVSDHLVERLRRRGITNLSAQELIDHAIAGFDPDRPPGSRSGFPFTR